MSLDFDFPSFDIFGESENNINENKNNDKIIEQDYNNCSKSIKLKNKNLFRRAFSETQLLDLLGIDFKDGESLHNGRRY